jgi:hypothetical protein
MWWLPRMQIVLKGRQCETMCRAWILVCEQEAREPRGNGKSRHQEAQGWTRSGKSFVMALKWKI